MKTMIKKAAGLAAALLLTSSVLAGCNAPIAEPSDRDWISVTVTPSATITSERPSTPSDAATIDELSPEPAQVSDPNPAEAEEKVPVEATDKAPAETPVEAADKAAEKAADKAAEAADKAADMDPATSPAPDPTPSTAPSTVRPANATVEYAFNNNQPSASKVFGGAFISEGTVKVTIQKIAVYSKTEIYFTVQNNTTETASFHMTKPTMIVDGTQINTTTFEVDTSVVPSSSRSFVYSFDTKLKKDTVFDLTMSIYVVKSGANNITVEGIDLSQATASGLGTSNQLLDFRAWDFTEEQKEHYQDLLNSLGEPTADAIDVIGFYCSYTNDGGLRLDAFIRNGTDKAINIRTFEPLEVLTTDGQVIASGNFPNDYYGILLPSQSVIWGFNYGKEVVNIPDADLSVYRVHSNCRY